MKHSILSLILCAVSTIHAQQAEVKHLASDNKKKEDVQFKTYCIMKKMLQELGYVSTNLQRTKFIVRQGLALQYNGKLTMIDSPWGRITINEKFDNRLVVEKNKNALWMKVISYNGEMLPETIFISDEADHELSKVQKKYNQVTEQKQREERKQQIAQQLIVLEKAKMEKLAHVEQEFETQQKMLETELDSLNVKL